MGLTENQRLECLRVMDQLSTRAVSGMFSKPINPKDDDCPNYYQVIDKPMDLGTVRKKLEENIYRTVEEWKKDVDLVWSNSLKYNKTGLITVITADLKEYFDKISRSVSDSVAQDWKTKLSQIRDELETAVKEIAKHKSGKKIIQKRDKLSTTLIELEPPHMRRHFVCLNHEEMEKLSEDLNRLNQETQLQIISQMLQKYEPDIMLDQDEIEININALQPMTLRLIRDRVNNYLHHQVDY